MSSLERRIECMENRLGLTSEPENLEDQWKKFQNGEYGKSTMMAVVVEAHHEGIEAAVKGFPEPLRSAFLESLVETKQKAEQATSGGR